MFDEFEWDSYFDVFYVNGCGGEYGMPNSPLVKLFCCDEVWWMDRCPLTDWGSISREVSVLGETGRNGTMTLTQCCHESYCDIAPPSPLSIIIISVVVLLSSMFVGVLL